MDFEALETAVRRAVLALASQLVARRLNADTADGQSARLPCACGAVALRTGRRAKTFTTALGPMRLERAYYHCPQCHQGFFPRDRALCLADGALSPAVSRMVGVTAALASFEESAALLRELAGVNLSAKEVERTAKGLGEEIARDEQADTEPLPGQGSPTMYLGVDGTGVPMRPEEVAGRSGKQADGSAKTREAKLCVIWTANSRDKDGRPCRDEGSISYTGAIESAAGKNAQVAPFVQRVAREALRRGFDTARRQIILADGALWIWAMADELYPFATQILDRYHAKDHLAGLSRTIFGPDSPEGQVWRLHCFALLDAGKVDDLLQQIRPFALKYEQAARDLDYFQRNRGRMDYPRYERLGFCTGSGVVEAGCKTVVGTRLKRAGMHWTVAGANAIMALRCCCLSGRFEDFWERRFNNRAPQVA